MPRPLRPDMTNGTYHVTARGNNGGAIFEDDYDRYAYLALLAKVSRLMDIRLLGYVLMTNHLHLIMQTASASISKAIHRLNGPYAYGFNRRYGRRGHLFENRFFSKVISTDVQLLETTRYVHLNPVEAGLVIVPEDFPWSSYRYYIHPEIPYSLVDPRPVLALISNEVTRSSAAYARFVQEGMSSNSSTVPGTVEV